MWSVNLTRLRGTYIASKAVFLGWFVEVFPEETGMWLGKLPGEAPPSYWADSIHLAGERERTNWQTKGKFSLFPCSGSGIPPYCLWILGLAPVTHSFSGPLLQTLASLILKLSELDWIMPLASLGFRLADDLLWDFSAFIIM